MNTDPPRTLSSYVLGTSLPCTTCIVTLPRQPRLAFTFSHGVAAVTHSLISAPGSCGPGLASELPQHEVDTGCIATTGAPTRR